LNGIYGSNLHRLASFLTVGLDMARKMIAGVIYKAVNVPYDEDRPEFDCYCPAAYVIPDNVIGDCWVCDEKGNIHAGYCNSPVPVHRDNLGEVVGNYYKMIMEG